MPRKFGGVRQLPSGHWQAHYTGLDGRRAYAPTTFVTEAQGRAWLDELARERAKGSWHDPSLGRQRFDAYAVDWLRTRDLKTTTRAYYAQLLDTHILPTFGLTPLWQITPQAVRAWHAHLATTTGPTARARAYSLLRAVLRTAVDDGALTANPARVRGASSTDHQEAGFATWPEVLALAELVPRRYRALVVIAADSAMRFGELVALTRADVDLKRLTAEVTRRWYRGEFDVPKTASSIRRVYLGETVRPYLEEHLAEWVGPAADALLFTTRNGVPPANNWINIYLRNAAAALPEPRDDLTFHSLRHTGARQAAETGASTKAIMARLGQSSSRAALGYQHAIEADDEEIARLMDKRRSGKKKKGKKSAG